MRNHLIVAAALIVAALLVKYLPARRIISRIPKVIYVTNLVETPVESITVVTQTVTKVVSIPPPAPPKPIVLTEREKAIIPEGVEIERSSLGKYRWVVNGWHSWSEFDTLAECINNWRVRNQADIENAKIIWEKVK